MKRDGVWFGVLGLLVILIVLMADPIAALFNEHVCLGPCSNCDQKCISKGYPEGGMCVGHQPSDLECCCFQSLLENNSSLIFL